VRCPSLFSHVVLEMTTAQCVVLPSSHVVLTACFLPWLEIHVLIDAVTETAFILATFFVLMRTFSCSHLDFILTAACQSQHTIILGVKN
jgi:hypothetical protein